MLLGFFIKITFGPDFIGITKGQGLQESPKNETFLLKHTSYRWTISLKE